MIFLSPHLILSACDKFTSRSVGQGLLMVGNDLLHRNIRYSLLQTYTERKRKQIFFCNFYYIFWGFGPQWAWVRIWYNLVSIRGFSHIMSSKNGGLQIPPPPVVSKNSEIGLPPPLSEKIRNWLTPLPPVVRNHILSHSNKLN